MIHQILTYTLCVQLHTLYVYYIITHTVQFSRNTTEGVDHGLINYKDINTKCRLYWRLIEFIDWRYSQLCWYFRPMQLPALPGPLTFSLVHLPPPLRNVKKVQNILTVCSWEGLGGGVELCWRPYSAGVYHSVSDQIQNLRNCYTTPNKNLGVEGATDRETPAAKSLYRSIF